MLLEMSSSDLCICWTNVTFACDVAIHVLIKTSPIAVIQNTC